MCGASGEAELQRTLRSPLVRREWPGLKSEFVEYAEFARYVEVVQGHEAQLVTNRESRT